MQQLQELKNNAQQGTTALAQQMAHPIKGKLMLLDKKKDLLGAGIPGHMLVEREIRSAGIMLMNSRELQMSTPESFYTAVSIAINTGIGLGRGQGYLIAYKNYGKTKQQKQDVYETQYVPGWRGLVDLVTRTGRATCWAGVVRKGDEFDYALGDSPFLKHKPGESEAFEDITHYYAIGRVKGSEWPQIRVWSAKKVANHLDQYNKVGDRHYAKKDNNNFEQYGQKVVLLQVIKYLPQSQEIANAVAADAAYESGKEAIIDGDMVWINEQDYQADQAPLAAEVHEPAQGQQTKHQQQSQQVDDVDQSTGEVRQTAQREETDEERDFRRSQEAEQRQQQKPAAAAQTEQAAPGVKPRRRTASTGGAPE